MDLADAQVSPVGGVVSRPKIPPDAHISAISPSSLSWNLKAVKASPTKKSRKAFQTEAMAWQQASQLGGWAAFRSVLDQTLARRVRPKDDPDRIVEIHAIAGAIGEQLALCWAGEQDAQRVLAAALEDEHRRLVLRAVSESAGHFLLGAAHSLGNLVVRVALLDSSAGPEVRRQLPTAADLSAGSDDRRAWVSLSKASEILKRASAASSNTDLGRCADAIEALYLDPRFRGLEDRRGMDFHRLRPQSVQHSSPRVGIVETTGATSSISMVAARFDSEADGVKVHDILVKAMTPVMAATRVLKREIPKSIRSSGYLYSGRLVATIKRGRPGR